MRIVPSSTTNSSILRSRSAASCATRAIARRAPAGCALSPLWVSASAVLPACNASSGRVRTSRSMEAPLPRRPRMPRSNSIFAMESSVASGPELGSVSTASVISMCGDGQNDKRVAPWTVRSRPVRSLSHAASRVSTQEDGARRLADRSTSTNAATAPPAIFSHRGQGPRRAGASGGTGAPSSSIPRRRAEAGTGIRCDAGTSARERCRVLSGVWPSINPPNESHELA